MLFMLWSLQLPSWNKANRPAVNRPFAHLGEVNGHAANRLRAAIALPGTYRRLPS